MMSRARSRRDESDHGRAWGGTPCDLSRLSEVARAHALPIVEDAALAFGATYDGRRIGSISDYTCFSFQATKHVTTVDGGALTCASPRRWNAAAAFGGTARTGPARWSGIGIRTFRRRLQIPHERRHGGDRPGAVETRRADLARHRSHARTYDEALQDCAAIRPLRLDTGAVGSYWTYTVRVAARDAFMKHMADAGIGVSRVFKRNDQYPAFAASRASLPGVDTFDAEQSRFLRLVALGRRRRPRRRHAAALWRPRNFFLSRRLAREATTRSREHAVPPWNPVVSALRRNMIPIALVSLRCLPPKGGNYKGGNLERLSIACSAGLQACPRGRPEGLRYIEARGSRTTTSATSSTRCGALASRTAIASQVPPQGGSYSIQASANTPSLPGIL
jgi:hypothetical protein